MKDLEIGAAMIKEALARELPKEEQAARRRAEEKAAEEAAKAKVLQSVLDISPELTALALQVKQAFYDDRKGRAITDERERTARAAAAARRAAGLSPEPEVADHRPKKKMPGSGNTLSGVFVEAEDNSVAGSASPAPRAGTDDEDFDEE